MRRTVPRMGCEIVSMCGSEKMFPTPVNTFSYDYFQAQKRPPFPRALAITKVYFRLGSFPDLSLLGEGVLIGESLEERVVLLLGCLSQSDELLGLVAAVGFWGDDAQHPEARGDPMSVHQQAVLGILGGDQLDGLDGPKASFRGHPAKDIDSDDVPHREFGGWLATQLEEVVVGGTSPLGEDNLAASALVTYAIEGGEWHRTCTAAAAASVGFDGGGFACRVHR